MQTVKVRIIREKKSGPFRIQGKVVMTLDFTYSTETLAPEVIRIPFNEATPEEKGKRVKARIAKRLDIDPEELELEYE